MQFDRIRPEAQRPFEIGNRPIRLTEILICVAQIVESIDRVRGEGESALVAADGLGEPIERSEDVAEVVVKSRVPAVSHDRRADVLDRLVGTAALMLDQAEQMKGLRMTGVDGQDLAAHPLRLRQASAALMGERRAEPPGDRRRRAACRATLLPQPGFDAPLLSVHRGLIAQPASTYPSSREIAKGR